jgi:hypothetical protein
MYFLDVDLKRSTDKLLVFRKYPYSQWSIGLILIVIGSVMMHFLLHSDKFDPVLYHYVTAAVIILLGLIFIVYGKIHILEIDKNAQQVRKNQMSIFCQDKLMLYDLNLIKGVKGF